MKEIDGVPFISFEEFAVQVRLSEAQLRKAERDFARYVLDLRRAVEVFGGDLIVEIALPNGSGKWRTLMKSPGY